MTASLPFGDDERFVVPEIEELERQGIDVIICPRGWFTSKVESDARHLVARTIEPRLLSPGIAAAAVREAVRSPRQAARAVWRLRGSRSPRMLLKNLAVVPKALWLARYLRRHEVEHVHAHWAGTTATLALVAGEVAGVPFSFTAHRWDIAENNLLPAKVRSASFSRAIHAKGAAQLAALSQSPRDAIAVIHMGVASRASTPGREWGEPPTIVTPASFVEIKGHTYLLQALQLLLQRGVEAQLELAGVGEERAAVEREIVERSLGDHVILRGFVPHDQLLDELRSGRYDMVVLPSIITAKDEQEGIPVALMEALAAGVPAVATRTGGIPELLDGDAGVLVGERDPVALAAAIERVITDRAHREAIIERGHERIRSAFSLEPICAELAARFSSAARR